MQPRRDDDQTSMAESLFSIVMLPSGAGRSDFSEADGPQFTSHLNIFLQVNENQIWAVSVTKQYSSNSSCLAYQWKWKMG